MSGRPFGRNPFGGSPIADLIEDHRETAIAGVIFLILLLGAVAVGALRKHLMHERASNPETLCRLNQPVTQAVLVLVDSTDPLAQDNAPRFRALIHQTRDVLPRFGRLTITAFDDDLARPLTPSFDVCSPGRRAEADARFEGASLLQATYDSRFGAPLDETIRRLTSARSAPRSPIAAQIERATSIDGWRGENRKLVILSDGLQNASRSVYRTGRVDLAAPTNRFLEGVEVEFIELPNPRDLGLQTAQGRTAWKGWLEAAGAASVSYSVVGLPVADGPQTASEAVIS